MEGLDGRETGGELRPDGEEASDTTEIGRGEIPDPKELMARLEIKDNHIRELYEEITASRLAADEARQDAFGQPLSYNKRDPRAFGVLVTAPAIPPSSPALKRCGRSSRRPPTRSRRGAACRQPFAFEDDFKGPNGRTRCWVTLLPFSATGTWIDYVYGFVSLDPPPIAVASAASQISGASVSRTRPIRSGSSGGGHSKRSPLMRAYSWRRAASPSARAIALTNRSRSLLIH